MTAAVLRIGVIAYQGVLADESEAFHAVLSRIPGARVLVVGSHLGDVAGPGGAQTVDATFAELDRPDVVVVPGGLGSHRHPEIGRWLRRTRPRWVLASSTGSALLAAAGLLRGHEAATHWLAGPLLERFGATVSPARLVVDDPYITCAGLASTFDAAFVVVRTVGGPDLEAAIREDLRTTATAIASGPDRPARTRHRARAGRDLAAATAPLGPQGLRSVEIELEDRPHPPVRARRRR